MKKLFFVFLVVITCLFFVACSEKDETAPTIIMKSENIEIEQGTDFKPLDYVTATDDIDGDLSANIVVKSNNVNTEISGSYTVVFEVRDKANNVSQSALIVVIKESYTDSEIAAISCIEALISILKDPSSLQVHSLYAYKWLSEGTYSYSIKVDYSARNSFGGLNRNTYYLNVETDGTVDLLQFDERVQLVNEAGWLDFNNEELNVDKVMSKIK